jgi:hypothetical protein
MVVHLRQNRFGVFTTELNRGRGEATDFSGVAGVDRGRPGQRGQRHAQIDVMNSRAQGVRGPIDFDGFLGAGQCFRDPGALAQAGFGDGAMATPAVRSVRDAPLETGGRFGVPSLFEQG